MEMRKKALLIVDHGSRNAEANEMLEKLADLLSVMRPELLVFFAHMEIASPSIAEAFEAAFKAGANEIIVHPYFLSPGRHATLDIPKIVAAVAKSYPNLSFWVSEPLGLDQQIAEVILKRAKL